MYFLCTGGGYLLGWVLCWCKQNRSGTVEIKNGKIYIY